MRTKVITRLKDVCKLQEELRYAAANCIEFCPSHSLPLLVPPGLHGGPDQEQENVHQSQDMTEDTDTITPRKKLGKGHSSDLQKSKLKYLKIKQKHEVACADRAMKALRSSS